MDGYWHWLEKGSGGCWPASFSFTLSLALAHVYEASRVPSLPPLNHLFRQLAISGYPKVSGDLAMDGRCKVLNAKS